MPAEALIARIEHRAQEREPFERIVAAVIGAMAIGPLVVAGDVDHRTPELIEQVEPVGEHLVGAERAAVLDVAVVGDKRKPPVGIDVGNDIGELRIPFRSVRHVANQREREGAVTSAQHGFKMRRENDCERQQQRRADHCRMFPKHESSLAANGGSERLRGWCKSLMARV